MQNISKYHFFLILTVVVVLICTACEDSDTMNADPDPEQEQSDDDTTPTDDDPDSTENPNGSNNTPNEISQALILNNAQFKTDSLPENSNLSNLQIDKDTINLWPGLSARIRIRNLDQFPIGGVLVQISGAGGHYEMPVVEEESIDSIAVIYVDIDPDGLDLPHEGDIVISPIDPNGNVIDEFEMPVQIDPPFDEDAGTGSDGTGMGKCIPGAGLYFWIYSMIDGQFYDAPGYPRTVDGYEVDGCCDRSREPHNSVPCLGKPPTDKVLVTDDYSLTDVEFVKLFDDTFIYQLDRSIKNFDYDESDFCEGRAGYSFGNAGLLAFGEFYITPANGFETFYNFIIPTMEIESRDFGVFQNFGPNENSTSSEAFISCKYLVFTSSTEGSTTTIVFEKGENDWFF